MSESPNAVYMDKAKYVQDVVRTHLDLIKFADTKAAAILTVLTTITITTIGAIYVNGISNKSEVRVYELIVTGFVVIAFAFYIRAAYHGLMVITPRGGTYRVSRDKEKSCFSEVGATKKAGVVNRLDICDFDTPDQYVKEFFRMEYKELLEELLMESWQLARIANQKYACLRDAVLYAKLSVLCSCSAIFLFLVPKLLVSLSKFLNNVSR